MDAYLINGIPRFILLDRDGNIISANMTFVLTFVKSLGTGT